MLRTVAALAATALLALPAGAAPKSFVVVTFDDVGWQLFDAAMTATKAVPGATVYPRAFVNVPLCGPSRAAFLTGQEAETTGITKNEHANWGTGFMPQALRQAGYRTMIVGKKPNGFLGTPQDLGFNRWAVIKDVDGDRYFDAELDVNGNDVTATGYTTDALYRRGRACVEGSRPFLCWVAAIGAHAPAVPRNDLVNSCNSVAFNPGPAFNEANMADKPSWMQNLPAVTNAASNFREQCATLKADDEGVRSILDMVAGDSSICVIVTADNGRMHGQHRLTGKNALYEESIGVPLMTWNCGTSPGTDNRLVSNVDIPAHILSLANVASLRPLDGRPLDGPTRSRVRIVTDTDEPAAGWRRQSTAEWSLETGESEFYDLADDPWQERSRSSLRR